MLSTRGSSLQFKRACDRGVVAASTACVAATTVTPMCRGIEDVVNAPISWMTLGGVSQNEAVVLQIAVESARVNPVEVGGMRVHVANHDRRSILDAQLPPLVQQHARDLGVRSLRAGLVVVVRQVRVEEPDLHLTQQELPPSDGTGCIVVTRNSHPTATEEGDFTGIEQDVVLPVGLLVCRIARKAGETVSVLALLQAHNCRCHFFDLGCIPTHPGIVISVLRVVAHDLDGSTT